jgi:hypothetical protein
VTYGAKKTKMTQGHELSKNKYGAKVFHIFHFSIFKALLYITAFTQAQEYGFG